MSMMSHDSLLNQKQIISERPKCEGEIFKTVMLVVQIFIPLRMAILLFKDKEYNVSLLDILL